MMIERPEPAPTHMAVAIVPFQVGCDSVSSVGSFAAGVVLFWGSVCVGLEADLLLLEREERRRGEWFGEQLHVLERNEGRGYQGVLGMICRSRTAFYQGKRAPGLALVCF